MRLGSVSIAKRSATLGLSSRLRAAARPSRVQTVALTTWSLVPSGHHNAALLLTCPELAEKTFATSITMESRDGARDKILSELADHMGVKTERLVLVCQDPSRCELDMGGLKLIFRGGDGNKTFEQEAHDCIYVKDLGSNVSITVDGSRLHHGEERRLLPGSRLEFGDVVYTLARELMAHA